MVQGLRRGLGSGHCVGWEKGAPSAAPSPLLQLLAPGVAVPGGGVKPCSDPSARCPGPQQQELNAQPQGWVWEGGSFPVWFPPPPRTPGGRGDRTKGGRGSREESLHLNPPFLFCKEAGAEHHTSYLALGR